MFARYFGRNFRPDTFFAAKIYFYLAKLLNYAEYLNRKRLSDSFAIQNKKIRHNEGYYIGNFKRMKDGKKVMGAINYFRRKHKLINWKEIEKKSKKPFLLKKEIKYSKQLQTICIPLVKIISKYIGCYPVFLKAELWHSPNKKNFTGRSQNWHIDGEDTKQIKVFIPLEKVDEFSGPLNFIDASNSYNIYSNLKKKKIIKTRNTKLSDDIIRSLVPKNFIKKMTMDLGEYGLLDTCRCYHFGSRKDKKPRKLIFLHFTSPFAENFPTIFRKPYLEKSNEEERLLYGYVGQDYKVLKSEKIKRWDFKFY